MPSFENADIRLHFAGSLSDQGRAVLEAVARGDLTPDQAATLLQALAAQARIVEMDETEHRVTALEQASRRDSAWLIIAAASSNSSNARPSANSL